MKEEIINWLNSERIFHDGAIIYYKYGRVKHLKETLLFTSPSSRLRVLLLYELCKLAGLTSAEYEAAKKNIKLPLSGP